MTSKEKGEYGSDEEAGYADSGLQSDQQPRYPLKEHGKLSPDRIRAAWSYIHHKDNAAKYTQKDVEQIKLRIKRAAKSAGVEISSE